MNIFGRSALIFLCFSQTLQAVSWTYVTQKYKQLHAWHTKTFDLPTYAALPALDDDALRALINRQCKHVAVLTAGMVLSGFCVYASCSYIGANAAADCVKHNIVRRFAGACVKTTSKGVVACSLPAPMVVMALCFNSAYDKICIINRAQELLDERKKIADDARESQQQKKRNQDLQAQQEDIQKKLSAMSTEIKSNHSEVLAKLDPIATDLHNHIQQQQVVNRQLAQGIYFIAQQLDKQGRLKSRAQGRSIAGRQQQGRIRQRAPRLLR